MTVAFGSALWESTFAELCVVGVLHLSRFNDRIVDMKSGFTILFPLRNSVICILQSVKVAAIRNETVPA
jgi:hypothetical protein